MSTDIAVICASPPGVNPGMNSVDLAFSHFARRRGFLDRVKFYQLYPSSYKTVYHKDETMAYSVIPPDDHLFQSNGLILYWGDFLHMRQYHEAVVNKLLKDDLFQDRKLALQRVQNVFLQSNMNTETLQKTVTFGSTLLFNTIRDELEPTYGPALERFLKLCKAVWFRDVYSALKACHIREEYHPNCLGVDCATLIAPEEVKKDARTGGEEKIGLFFGRIATNPEAMFKFAAQLSRRTNINLAWMPWGDAEAFPKLPSILKAFPSELLKSGGDQTAAATSKSLSDLLNYRLIITDTYHVCVNAWNLGVPAICLVENVKPVSRSVNSGDAYSMRDKRQVFFGMYDALDFFVLNNELENNDLAEARISHLINLLNSSRETEAICSRIRLHARSMENKLAAELNILL
jgi:hypothetical protein